jgi:hypothetical protein
MPGPRRRPDETSQVHGRRFERFWAALFGVKPVKGSGALWYAKLDVNDASILWSLKHTDSESFRLHKGLMSEAEHAIHGPGGVGGSTIPGIATSVDGEVFVTLHAEDFIRLMKNNKGGYIPPTKSEGKRTRAKTIGILRDEPEHD